jgi:hypothetical protein
MREPLDFLSSAGVRREKHEQVTILVTRSFPLALVDTSPNAVNAHGRMLTSTASRFVFQLPPNLKN